MTRKVDYANWMASETWIGDRHYHTFNPPTDHKHVERMPEPKDTILLDGGFLARPVYQTQSGKHKCPFCNNIKFLGYQLVMQESGHYWMNPRPLDQIRQHHAKCIEAIRAARGIARVGALCLESAQQQLAA